jgi:protein associated with RNAse G/E
MTRVWSPGDSCVLRGVINNKVWLAQSVIVVKDTPEETILCLLPGAQCAYPENYWRWRQGDYSAGTRWQEARSQNLAHREFTWQTNRVLMFLEPDKYYSCFLFWNHEADRFDSYYINFQLPYSRSHIGFETLDLDLDIVIDPQYNWTWKDEDEYRDGIREGGIQQKWVKGIEQAQPEVFDRIRNHRYPLDGSWTRWKPDPAWDTPCLPENWKEI